MPEYLAPGVYVEETSFRSKSIEGVSTSTTGFAGPTRRGPTGGAPELVTSFADFERIYGGFANLSLTASSAKVDTINYVAHAVQAYFNEGGSRLYVARVYSALSGNAGKASAVVVGSAGGNDEVSWHARSPGEVGNGTIKSSVVTAKGSEAALKAAPPGSVFRSTPSGGGTASYFVKAADGTWANAATGGTPATPTTAELGGAELLTLSVVTKDGDGREVRYEGLGLAPAHPRWIGAVLGPNGTRRADDLERLYAITIGSSVGVAGLITALDGRTSTLMNGDDGAQPDATAYGDKSTGPLSLLGAIDDISIFATPGSSAYAASAGIRNALITFAERRRGYAIAVLETAASQLGSGAQGERDAIDSTHAALYYPWVVVPNPLAKATDETIPKEITLPPAGFVCGIYARSDNERGVFKAPANEVVRSALRFERDISFAEQETLNPRGINCLRYFPGRGYRVWGARTVSSDPEWKYVNVRRYFNYLGRSIDVGTQWAVFEPNGERLWANIRETISSFLYNEWRSGALLGGDPKEAFFVRCDRTTMDQNDLDNGRLICLVGVAVVKPAEFVVFRIGQKTADSRN
ncbi:phage tail sheath family protein [Sorangium sp. So ce388]|uniref:phage tail sheath family protein n=1 Tax=Sorangium sp. So ce388 TaxID=3133309 RepID=UPI003F5C1D6E